MRHEVVVGCVQMTRRLGNKAYNVTHALELLREAAQSGVQVVALPELFSTGYFPWSCVVDNKYFDWAETIPGPTIDKMLEAAADLGITIIVPIFELDWGHKLYFNSAAVVAPNGLLGRYRKRHIPSLPNMPEKHYFSPGDLGYPVFTSAGVGVGVSICYDRHFPETFRHLALAGSEIVFSVNNTPTPRSRRMWIPEIQAAASSNGIFIVQVNATGEDPGFFGLSFVCGPEGDVLKQLNENEEGVLAVRVDITEIARARLHYGAVKDTILSDLGLLALPAPSPATSTETKYKNRA